MARATFIVRNLTQEAIAAVLALPAREAYAKLQKWAFGDLRHCVSVQFGPSNTFGDRVEWNGIMKGGRNIAHKIEPRKGYKLITFEPS